MSTSKYPQLIAFAKENPLPRDAAGLALGILDVATLLVACKSREAKLWDSMSLSLMYAERASAYPGAFLSNPAMLLDTTSSGPFWSSMGGHGAGCFFSYSHYQEDSLGPALLLPGFSPRTMPSAIPARGYAKAIALMVSQGFLASASMSVVGSDLSLDDFAKGAKGFGPIERASMRLVFDREHIAALDHLRTSLGMKAARLAISDDKPGLFDDAARDGLLALANRKAVEEEAESIAKHVEVASPRTKAATLRI